MWLLVCRRLARTILIYVGNGGTGSLEKATNVPIQVTEFGKLVELAKEMNVNLVVPGPELPLIEGIEEWFRKAGIPCFGPTPRAARMEGSKAFSKEFMIRHNIPTARSEVYLNTVTITNGRHFLRMRQLPNILKEYRTK